LEFLDVAGVFPNGKAFIGSSFAEGPWAFFFNCSRSLWASLSSSSAVAPWLSQASMTCC